MNIDIKTIKSGLDSLASAVDELASSPAPTPAILDRELSGNKINGGMITNFKSVGVTDEAKSTKLTIHNDGITVDKIHTNILTKPVTVQGDLTVHGLVHATKLQVDEVTADVRNERTSSLSIRKFRMITKELDHEDGDMTATQKVKRNVLMEKFSDLIEDMYK